jgi:beta-galactosidase
MAGRPAVTMNKAGRGHVLYVAADTREMGFHERLFEALAGRFRIEPILDVPVGVEVVSRVAGDRKFVFLLNLTRESQVVPLPAACKELIEGQKVRGKLQLPPYEVAILEF